jgi:3-hydroxyisobutyrate dehydrogenase-like beta-hydroxyacid dehydrogenase
MDTIGFIGVGKIGLPICDNLIKSGYRVVGFRRSSLADFEKLGGVPAKSSAEVGAAADVVFTCLPSDEALQEVVQGPHGLLDTARPGQIVVELGSHPVPVKQKYVPVLATKGVSFIDGEVSGTPGMVAARKGVIFLGGDREAVRRLEPIVAGFADSCSYFGPFGTATKAKLINNLLVGLHIAGTAQAMAIAAKTGVDMDLLVKSIASGSGGSTQFGIRAPWMVARKFTPQQGSAPGLAHYLDMVKDFADAEGVATPLLDCLIDIYRRALPGIGERDVAAIIELFENDSQPKREATP